MNPTSPLLVPFFGMMLTTFFVWIFMYIRRLSWIFANRVPSHQISRPEKMSQVPPEVVNHSISHGAQCRSLYGEYCAAALCGLSRFGLLFVDHGDSVRAVGFLI